jgi:hypothetical protein
VVDESGGRLATTPVQVAPDQPVGSGPDLVVQMRVSDSNPCLEGLRGAIAALIAGTFTTEFPNAFVDNGCAGGPDPANEAAAFGVWLTEPADKAAAHTALEGMSIGRAQRESIAFYINTTFFEAAAVNNFPKDPSGSIHLHKPLHLEYRSPDTIITRVSGVDSDPIPDADFTETITEQFTGGPCHAPQWYTATPSLDVDNAWLYDVEAALLTLGCLITSWAAPLAIAGWYQAGEVAGAGPQTTTGVGSAVASAVMPLSIAIPGGNKLPIEYVAREEHNGGVEVDGSGMYVGGFIEPAVPREPFVSLSGMTSVGLHVGGGDVDDTITTHTWDMRGNLTFAWTLNGHPFPSTEPSITLSFNPSVGPFGTQNVGVKVTDEDGLVAEGNMQVVAEQEQRQGVNQGSSDNPIHPA